MPYDYGFMHSLHAHLQSRLASAYRRLQESLANLAPEDARSGRRDDWRRYRFGVGLNGSIEGIVRHVATWKHAAAEGLLGGNFPSVESVLPPESTWESLVMALVDGQRQLSAALGQLSEEELDASVVWEGHAMPRHVLVAHLIEHDQYHTGQINLLRQQLGHDLE